MCQTYTSDSQVVNVYSVERLGTENSSWDNFPSDYKTYTCIWCIRFENKKNLSKKTNEMFYYIKCRYIINKK